MSDQMLDVKVPPNNLNAEQSILGSLMLDPNTWDEIIDLIRAEDFYKPAHRRIFEAIADLRAHNEVIDLITVGNYLTEKSILNEVGGSRTLVEIVENTVSPANIATHAKIVRDKALSRRLITTCSKTIERAFQQEYENIENFIDQVEGEIFELGQAKVSSGLVGAMEVVRDSMERIEFLYSNKSDVTGIRTGFSKFDEMTAGLQPSELIIIAARPSMGKTAFSLNLALEAALNQKKTVAYFSLEMSKEAVMTRCLSGAAKIDMGQIKIGKISDEHWPRLISTAGLLSESPLFIDDTSGISPFEIRSKCRRLKAKHGLDLIMVDYLQLMSLKTKVESREREVAEISKTLKAIARELKVPVVALAQLNRGVEGRGDKRPMLSDLRESGSIEQDADVICMLYRDDYYDKEDSDKQGHAEIIIGKQRNGPTGTVKLKFDANTGQFKDPTPGHYEPRQPQSTNKPKSFRPQNFAPGNTP